MKENFFPAQNRQKFHKGFTLIELLVGLSIFLVASLFITDIFVISSRALRKGAAIQKVQSDARLIINTMGDQIRQGTINYGFYTSGIANSVNILALLDVNNQPVIYRKSSSTFSSTVCPTADSTPCLEFSRDGGTTWASVTSKDVKIQSLNFYIAPTTNPFIGGGPNVQPRVTVVMSLQGIGSQAEDQAPVFIQTTISSRQYLR